MFLTQEDTVNLSTITQLGEGPDFKVTDNFVPLNLYLWNTVN